jgi:hypothetical protein
MSKFIGVIIGGIEIIGGAILVATGVGGPLGGYLISAGVGMVLTGIGTLLSQGPLTGTAVLSRNPVAPWNVVYGRQKLGGILVHLSEFDENNKYLDLVIVLACHASQGNVVLLFDGQRVRLDANGCSFTPTQQTISFVSITRANGVVAVVLTSPITDLQTGDTLQIQNVSDHTFNGRYAVTVVDSLHFTYICGGSATTVSGSGQALTLWPNYKAKVHMEVLLGDHTDTFPGMINGTPYDGDPGNLVIYPNNPWTADHRLLGKTSVFLRLHYNDEIFANGLPTIAFRLSGKKDIYDPRTSPVTYGYTENPALIIADYLAHPVFGFKAAYGTEIPLDKLIAAANICDEAVPLAAGGTEPRYRCNGGFPLTVKRGEVLQNLLTSCGGRLTYTQGQFVIWPAAWPGSSIFIGGHTPSGLTPPVAVPSGQTVAWAYPRRAASSGLLSGCPGLFCPATGFAFGTAGSNPTGSLGYSQSRSFGNNTATVHWDDFVVDPALPWDAVIHAIYPVMLASAFHDRASSAYRCNGNLFSSPSNPDGTTFGSTQWTGASVGSSLAGLSMEVALSTSLVADGMGDSVTITNLGYAIYYTTSAIPSGLPGMAGSAQALSIAAGPFRWREKVGIRDLYNGVKGTYISPANNWQSSDIPPYAQDQLHGYMSGSPMYPFGDANLAADGGERRWLDIQLPFTISSSMAQRLEKIELMRRRQQGTGTFSYNMAMYRATALDVVTMTLPLLNWVEKLLEIAAHRFTIQKQQVDGNDVTLLGTEIDVQETDSSVYDWSPTEELTVQGFQQPTIPGSIDGGGSTLVNNSNYANTPAIALSQPDATHIALAAVSVAFSSGTVTYNARSIVISDPGGSPTWYYVTIQDPDYLGDQSPQLAVFAELTTAKVGVAGYTYLGAIQCTHAAGGSATPLPGGWPAPTAYTNVP